MFGELLILAGTAKGKGIFLGQIDRVVIGRASSADLQIDEATVSRTHCLIRVKDGRCIVTDLSSRHGTQLNGQGLSGPTEMRADDVLSVGRVSLRLVSHVPANAMPADKSLATSPTTELEDSGEVSTVACVICDTPISLRDLRAGQATRQGEGYRCPLCVALGSTEQQPVSHWTRPSDSGKHPGFVTAARGKEPTPVPPTEPPKHVFGPYELHERLGGGAMGVVYRTWERPRKRWVAMKVLRPERSGDADVPERFQREATIGLRLKHPGIVRCFDFGTSEGFCYIAMELVQGDSLQDLLRHKGKIPPWEALDWTEQTLAALEYAHGQRVIHRDLKPGNLLLAPPGQIKITDFGLAKALETSGFRLTGEGALLGTPMFMPPEQVRDAATADERSDLYAVGAILFNLLTGDYPFPAFENLGQLCMAMLHQTPRKLRMFWPDAPGGLEQLLQRALSKDPGARFQSALEMREQVRVAQSLIGPVARHESP